MSPQSTVHSPQSCGSATGPQQFLAAERHARFSLRLYHVPVRPLLCAHVVIDHTLASEVWTAVILKTIFAQQTGIAVRDVTRQLRRLGQMGIVVVHDEADTYTFQLDTRAWQAQRRHVAAVVLQRVLPGILLPGQDFKTALAELGRDRVLDSLRSVSTPAGQTALSAASFSPRLVLPGGAAPPPAGGELVRRGESPPAAPPGGSKLPPPHILVNRLTGTGTGTGNRSVETYRNRFGGESPPPTPPPCGSDFPPATGREDEAYWLAQVIALCGEAERRNTGRWRLAIRHHQAAFYDAYTYTKLQRDSGTLRTTAARCLNAAFNHNLNCYQPA